MPKQKRRRGVNGSVRRRPIRDEQEQYRHSHGLSTHDITLRQCFQMQMSSSTIATNTLCTNIADLLAYSTIVHVGRNQTEDNIIEQEIAILMHSQNNIIQPLYDYYSSIESQLCDVPDDIHDVDHEC